MAQYKRRIIGTTLTKAESRVNFLLTQMRERVYYIGILIARKIAKKGTKGTKFASSVLTDKDLNELYESLAEKLAEDVANQMFE